MAAPVLEQLLTELLEPDSAAIRRATVRLREALEEPEAPRGLAGLLRDGKTPQVRHLAAVLLRRLLRKLPQDLIDRLPYLVVEALDQETDFSTRGSLAQLGAKLLLLGGPKFWDPLEKWIQKSLKEPQKMEGALRVVGVAVGVAGPALSGRGPALCGLARRCLGGQSQPGVLAAALGALGALAAAMGGRKTKFISSLVPDVLRALQELLSLDEARGADAFEVLDEFLEANPDSLIPHLRPLLELCLQVAGDECRGDTVRARALATVTFLAQERPRALLRGGLLAVTLRGLLVPLCAPMRPQSPDPEEGGEGPCPRHGAAQALDALAQGLPPEKLLKELLPLLEGPGRSAEAGGRKGALLALAAVARGCGATLRQRYLGVVLGALRAGLADPAAAVRGAAAAALRELREELQPEVAPLAAEALPKLLGEFGEPQNGPNWPQNPEAKSWFLLEALLEALGEEVGPWLPQVLPRILGVLENSGDPRSKELALSALHALAAGPAPLPLPSPALGAVAALARGGQHQLQALEVLGALGVAMVGEGLLEALELALGLAPGDDDATKVTLQLLSAVSELLGEGAEPLLPRVMPVLQGALRPPPAQPPSEAPDWLLNLHDDLDGAEPMEDDVTEWAEPVEPEVGGAFPGLAEAALGALGEVAENCGSAFLPYLEPSLAAVLDLTQFPQAELRAAAYETLGSLCRCGGARTAPGPVQQGALRALLAGLRADPEVGVALGAVGGVGRILQPPGHAPPEWLEPIGAALCDVIVGQVACVRSRDDDEDETAQGAELRETASDWLTELAKTRPGSDVTGRGVAFPPHLFRRLLPSLLAALADPAHPGARSWAAAVIGQLGHALGPQATPFLPDLGPAFRLAAGDPDPEVRANAFYAIGRIGEAVGHAHQDGAWPGAELCSHALRAGEGPGRVRDNILGALVRQQGAPYPEALSLVLGALPLTEDLEEEEPVLDFLLRAEPEQLQPRLPELLRGLGPALARARLRPALSQSLLSLLRRVGVANPQLFQVGVASMDPAQAAILLRMLDDVTGSQ